MKKTHVMDPRVTRAGVTCCGYNYKVLKLELVDKDPTCRRCAYIKKGMDIMSGVNLDRERTGLISDVIVAARKRIGRDDLYCIMPDKFDGEFRVGYIGGGDLDLLGAFKSADETIEFIKGLML